MVPIAVTAKVYTKFFESILDKKADLNSDTIKVMLLSAYTPNQNSHQYLSNVTSAGTEASGTGYTAGGATMSSPTFSTTGNVVKFTGGNVQWADSTVSATHAVIYVSLGGSASADPVVAYVDFGGTVSTTAGTFQINWHANGIFTITTS